MNIESTDQLTLNLEERIIHYNIDENYLNKKPDKKPKEKEYNIVIFFSPKGTIINKEDMRIYNYTKESTFRFMKFLQKIKYIGIKGRFLYAIKEFEGKKMIKKAYELKRIFKISIKVLCYFHR